MISRTSTAALSTAAILCVGLGLVATPASAQQKPLRDQVIGTWTVVSWNQTLANGGKLQRFGVNPKGINVFGADGRFFVMFARADLPKLSSNDPMKPSPDEARLIAIGAIAYYGTYTVDEPAKTLNLRVEASTLPNLAGTEQKRMITSLTADGMTYRNPTPTSGGEIEVALKRAQTSMTTGAGSMGHDLAPRMAPDTMAPNR